MFNASEDQKTQTSIYFKRSDHDFQTLTETIGRDFEAFIGNHKLSSVFEKLSQVWAITRGWVLRLTQLFLVALLFLVTIFCVCVSNC